MRRAPIADRARCRGGPRVVRSGLSQALLLLSLFPLATPGYAQRGVDVVTEPAARLALVIGNDAYSRAPLRNAVNDARAMSATLRSLGFSVQQLEDLGREALDRAVNDFVGRLGPGAVGLFYYAGHGLQVEGRNYLLPVDFDAADEVQAKYRALAVDEVRERMERAGVRLSILILDACRDNPFRTTRSGVRGLAAMQGGRGSLIAFATGPGRTASDTSVGSNGLFTHHLLAALEAPGLDLDDVFDRVRVAVDAASGHSQVPWVVSSVIGEFYFRPRLGAESAAAPSSAVPPAAEATPDVLGWSRKERRWSAVGVDEAVEWRRVPEGKFQRQISVRPFVAVYRLNQINYVAALFNAKGVGSVTGAGIGTQNPADCEIDVRAAAREHGLPIYRAIVER